MSKKEIVAAGLVIIMLICLLLQGVSYLIRTGKSLSPQQERFNHFLDNVYCLCLFGIGILVVMIAVIHDQTP
ncbi:hypothetical protein [Fructilactobacillus carniphilus]|uniref:Uncharacterized protein n=1 Tax=Fructilactobacillus carniphilus TaxID=2940297 RepID=A0ABY5BZ70_9LACO|nr:hypothetical protein [Fructilactobacillus carniphilus]USS91238.1 hypothetical protein M3M37_03305 [Fructilactobacillus carniphilus]